MRTWPPTAMRLFLLYDVTHRYPSSSNAVPLATEPCVGFTLAPNWVPETLRTLGCYMAWHRLRAPLGCLLVPNNDPPTNPLQRHWPAQYV